MAERSWKLLDLLGEASSFFSIKGMEEPRLEAELLLSAALEVRRLDLYLQFDRLLAPDEVAVFRGYVRRRLQGEPVQYVTGLAAFRLLELEVSPQVLIPRPETEVLVEVALQVLRPQGEPRVLDVGSGSGAIAVSLAREHGGARVVATDIAPRALVAARANARRHDLDGRVQFACMDLFAAFGPGAPPGAPTGAFDAVVSNPPYVATGDLADLAPEVRDHEPHLALDGGADGLQVYRRIAAEVPGALRPGGHLLLEVGDGQADAVCTILAEAGCFCDIEVRPDLNRVPRVVLCREGEG